MGCSLWGDNSPVVDPEQQMIYTVLEKYSSWMEMASQVSFNMNTSVIQMLRPGRELPGLDRKAPFFSRVLTLEPCAQANSSVEPAELKTLKRETFDTASKSDGEERGSKLLDISQHETRGRILCCIIWMMMLFCRNLKTRYRVTLDVENPLQSAFISSSMENTPCFKSDVAENGLQTPSQSFKCIGMLPAPYAQRGAVAEVTSPEESAGEKRESREAGGGGRIKAWRNDAGVKEEWSMMRSENKCDLCCSENRHRREHTGVFQWRSIERSHGVVCRVPG
ncbi:uncharacterized protein V6R79_020375 [Siganus canaliculatus]